MFGMVEDIVEQCDCIIVMFEVFGYMLYEFWLNFVLFGGVVDLCVMWQQLYDCGVLVCDVGIFGYFWVSVGIEVEIIVFLDVFVLIGLVL